MADTDPITQVHTGIWTMLEAFSDFTTAVKSGNRIKYVGGTRAPEKSALAVSDTPQVAVFSLGLLPHSEQTSNSSKLEILWSIEATVGTRKFETAGNLEFVIWRALLHWRTYLRGALTWGGLPFVTLFRPKGVDDEIVSRRKLRVPDGWTSLWVGMCECHFSTSLLKG